MHACILIVIFTLLCLEHKNLYSIITSLFNKIRDMSMLRPQRPKVSALNPIEFSCHEHYYKHIQDVADCL